MRLGLSLILLGILITFFGVFLLIFETFPRESNAEFAGFVFLGPIPIGISSNKQLAYATLALGFLFLFFLFIFSKLG